MTNSADASACRKTAPLDWWNSSDRERRTGTFLHSDLADTSAVWPSPM